MSSPKIPSGVEPFQRPSQRPGPPGGVRAQNRQERTQAIATAGLQLFLARGLEAPTIDEITAGASVAKGSFYRYFSDKNGLVEALFAPLATGVDAALNACEADLETAHDRPALARAYEQLGLALGRLVLEHRDVVHLYLIERRGAALGVRAPVRRIADRIEQRGIAVTERALERGLLRPFDARVSALAVVGAVEQLLYSMLSGRTLGDLAQIPAQLTSLILDGLRHR